MGNHITITQSVLDDSNSGLVLQKGEECTFGQRNFVIGPNGGGKTRLLELVKTCYENNNYTVIFANFPELVGKVSQQNDDIDESIFDSLIHSHDIEQADILAAIEADILGFFEDLSSYAPRTANQKTRIRATLEELSSMFGRFFHETGANALANEISKSEAESDESPFAKYYNMMSPGERNLLYISIFLTKFAMKKQHKNFVILIDEPELHLHHSVVNTFIETVENIFEGVPVWIASHSVHLLTRYRFDEITYLENGKILRETSDLRAKIINTVLGAAESSRELLLDVESWEYLNFVRQCFEDAEDSDVKLSGSNDPQFQAFLKLLNEKISTKDTLRVLDYGAGQGRFGTMLKSVARDKDWTEKQLEYHTYYLKDKYTGEFGKAFPKGKDYGNEKANVPHGMFDIVLLVNTLHEIDIRDWIGSFRTIYNALTPDGCLFFCEAQVLADGEKPTEHGYLVLCKEALATLFQVDSFVSENGKIISAQIPRTNLERDDLNWNQSLQLAVQDLRNSSLEKAKALTRLNPEDENSTKNQSRKRAFYAMQHINAEVALDMLSAQTKVNENHVILDLDTEHHVTFDFDIKNELNIKIIGIGNHGHSVISYLGASATLPSNTTAFAFGTEEVKNSHNKSSYQLLAYVGEEIIGSNLTDAWISMDDMPRLLAGTDIVFILAGMGDTTGSADIAPMIADIARGLDLLTVGIIMKPESPRRIEKAEAGIENLLHHVDSLFVISAEKLRNTSFDISDKRPYRLLESTTSYDIYDKGIGDLLHQLVTCISDATNNANFISIDFDEISFIMWGAGYAYFGEGRGSGKEKAENAAQAAISHPLMTTSIENAKSVLVSIIGSMDFGLEDVEVVASLVQEAVHPNANISFAAAFDENLDDEIHVKIIAC